jgi:hypothetical protein
LIFFVERACGRCETAVAIGSNRADHREDAVVVVAALGPQCRPIILILFDPYRPGFRPLARSMARFQVSDGWFQLSAGIPGRQRDVVAVAEGEHSAALLTYHAHAAAARSDSFAIAVYRSVVATDA